MDPGFFEGGWYLGMPEPMDHGPIMLQFENWELNFYTRNTGGIMSEFFFSFLLSASLKGGG